MRRLNYEVVRGEWGFKGHLITDAAVTDYASHFVDQLMGYTDMICFDFDKVSGPVIVDYLNQTDDGIVLLRLRDMTKNTIYAFSHSADNEWIVRGQQNRINHTVVEYYIKSIDCCICNYDNCIYRIICTR